MLIFYGYTNIMNTRTSPFYLKPGATSSKRGSFLQSGVNAVNAIFSLLLTAVAAIFVMWLNVRQKEFDQLEDKPQ